MVVLTGDTIAAISTPPGLGAIGIVRISGPDALSIICSHTDLSDLDPQRVYRTTFSHGRRPVDVVLVTYYRAPRSYTGEDLVEINCHGGFVIPPEILKRVIHSGARLAEPGEFTRRAFLNGKMDLLQAEAVADLIHGSSEAARQISLQILNGRISDLLLSVRDDILNLTTVIEHELDFREDEIDYTPPSKIRDTIDSIINRLSDLLRSYHWGRYNREGFLVPIVGKTNAGKSSLLNSILHCERSIVSPVPGTTRDYIEESVLVDGVLLRFVDTAGLQSTRDDVESEGIARTRGLIRQAQAIVFIVDITDPGDYGSVLSGLPDVPVLLVFNKTDLMKYEQLPQEKKHGRPTVYLSAMHGHGLSTLLDTVISEIRSRYRSESSFTITRERHKAAIEKAIRSLMQANDSLRQTPDLLATDLREALNAIGEITGHITTDDILDRIFSEFCVGK